MLTVVFLGIAILAAYKVNDDVQVDPPFEWAGELFAVVVSFTVAAVGTAPLHLLF